MNEDKDSREETRYEMRKRKNMNRILNISILVVGGLILFFAAQLFLEGKNDVSEETTESVEETNNQMEEEQTAPKQNTPDSEPDTDEGRTPQENKNTESESSDNDGSQKENEPQLPDHNGEWEPIGTEQTGSYNADFTKGSQNWQEMESALQYATGISEGEMIIWWLENGGNQTAVGTVSDYNHQNKPFQVTMKFIENEGWTPTDVKVLESNPYVG
ncbi:YrrS family protein [Bacillus piscicola]|uniref:YrrS family protein n=1 Tax=Bacillus piscicola TaxID=1632684 RepID=UPI001F0968F9|nr:YrrS family protein [Bacillus piscicola]